LRRRGESPARGRPERHSCHAFRGLSGVVLGHLGEIDERSVKVFERFGGAAFDSCALVGRRGGVRLGEKVPRLWGRTALLWRRAGAQAGSRSSHDQHRRPTAEAATAVVRDRLALTVDDRDLSLSEGVR
jgi:hypothetical protein